MNTFWNRPSGTTPIQPAMELATSQIHNISHWLSTNNKHVRIGLAITLPGVVLLLFTTPITNKLAQAWGRRTTETASTEKETVRPESIKHDTNETPPELPKKSYGQLSSGKRVARPERAERDTNDKVPELLKNSHESIMSRKRPTRSERSERSMNNDNILFNNHNNNSGPTSPKKSYAAAPAAPAAPATPATPGTASVEPFSPFTPDSASINSESSSEHSQKRKFRLGQNIKKRWQNRPFGHGHGYGSSESPLSP